MSMYDRPEEEIPEDSGPKTCSCPPDDYCEKCEGMDPGEPVAGPEIR